MYFTHCVLSSRCASPKAQSRMATPLRQRQRQLRRQRQQRRSHTKLSLLLLGFSLGIFIFFFFRSLFVWLNGICDNRQIGSGKVQGEQ